MKNLLLLSSSRYADHPYLEQPLAYIRSFLPDGVKRAAFVPYAGVTITYPEYHQMVSEALATLNIDIINVAEAESPTQAIADAELILVGGGNTFELLKQLYENELLHAIRAKVESGTPYIGWSAGSNMAGPTICTTNDMPIVEPPSFNALDLVPYQINPHFTDATLPGHNGESRSQRLAEYLVMNQDQKVICLPEGCAIEVRSDKHTYLGVSAGKQLTLGVDQPLNDGEIFLS
ncbi:dipeptidase PepE [Corallincola platygyrae]|uniref:Dipeptidase PepE n=1 Tax=Corallincola platygyrae TaxID=1193278 RepID=A0ABW4XK99_9GAMM